MTVALVCRGCCCGSSKHPDVDHAQIAALAAAADVQITECLGPCRWSNVIAAVDPDTGHQTWFGKVLAPAATAAVADWLVRGTGGPPPEDLVREPPAADRARALAVACHVRQEVSR